MSCLFEGGLPTAKPLEHILMTIAIFEQPWHRE